MEQEFCCAVGDQKPVKMTYAEAHSKLGHMSNQATKTTAQALQWKLTGESVVCKSCAEGKAKQKSIMVKKEKG